MPESTLYPQEIEIDTIDGGIARLLAHWNIETIIRDEQIFYQYEEAVIRWTLPDSYTVNEQTLTITTRDDVEAYISANAVEIMSFAKATKLMV